jgi:hypothetical protein
VVPFFTQSPQPVLPELLNAFRSTFLKTNYVQEEPAKKPKGKNPHTQEDSYNLEALVNAGMGSCSQSPQCFQIKFFSRQTLCARRTCKETKGMQTHSGVCIPNFLGMEALFLSFVLLSCIQYYYLEKKRLTKAGNQEPFCRKSSQESHHTLPRVEHRIDEELHQHLPLTVNSFLDCTCPWQDTLLLLLLSSSHLLFLFLSSLS